MAKIYTGRDGSLLLDGTTLVKVASWSLQGEMETLESTTLGDDQKTFVPGLQSFSGSASLLYYSDDANRNDASTLLRKIVKTSGVSASDTAELTLRLSDGNVNKDMKFTVYITSVSIGASVGEISKADINFQVTGAPTSVTI
jgi:hypothetical protein